jgi:hypothetical protein
MPRFTLRDLFLLVAALAIVLAGYRYLWRPPPDPNARAYLALYLVTLSFATLGSFHGRPQWRRPCQGYAVFGWLILVCVLWGGFGLSDYDDAMRVVHGVHLGVVLGVLSALLTGWLLEEVKPPDQDRP